ncbi:MAG: ECF-type sigma factor [Dokdonella sp.]
MQRRFIRGRIARTGLRRAQGNGTQPDFPRSRRNTMGTTGLVHEAWLRIVGPGWPDIESRRHFFGIAAEAMRRIMIERARSAGRQKRGNHATRITLQEYHGQETRNDSIDLVALDQALSELEAGDSGMSQVVKLRYFCGLTAEEVAEVLEISPRTVDRKMEGRPGLDAGASWLRGRADRVGLLQIVHEEIGALKRVCRMGCQDAYGDLT